ncbi:MAG: PhoH family protein [Leptonema sp. (in: Bacteria)]|nr:PhoH family protein [Leptonema sp. (in: bacteria)]
MEQSQITEDYILLDTNVLLLDPNAYIKFANRHIVIPLIVIEELDSFKRELTSIGKAAREIIRTIDVLRVKGRITEGVKLENGSTIQVYILQNYEDLPKGLDHAIKDNYILSAALQLQKKTGRPTALVTKDADLRIKADVLGITAWDYHENGVQGEQLYSGERTIQVSDDLIDRFFKGETLNWKDSHFLEDAKQPLLVNEYLTLKSASRSALARCSVDGNLRLLFDRQSMSVKPRNREQRFALDALLDPDIRLVTIAGKAGTGKTLIAIAAGLELVLSDQRYRKLLVARPVVPMGKDLGFLPGELSEKLRPWMQPIYDNLDFILGDTKNREQAKTDESKEKIVSKKGESTVEYLKQADLIDVEPLTYIRGRSIPYQYMIIDEAQNLSPHEAKTIITRAGEGTKVVFTGDFYQIDHPYLNQYTNGLSFTFNRMKGQNLFAHITLDKGERSELAELASRLMEN